MSQMWQIKVVFVLLVYDLFRFNVKFSVRLVGALVITFSRFASAALEPLSTEMFK